MPLDLAADARRLRIGLLLVALVFLGVLAMASWRALWPEWEAIQQGFFALSRAGSESPPAIRQQVTCTGGTDRCTTCHLGVDRSDLADPAVPQPYRGHPRALAHHLRHGSGCSTCHGGTGRALTVAAAHAMPGTGAPDYLMRQPHLQASCARCHVPGAVPGSERLASGAGLYLELGCPVCHPLRRGGLGGADYGPDLRLLGRKSPAWLEASMVDPSANFPESTMPPFDRTFRDHPEALVDLLVFLQSLALRERGTCAGRDPAAGLVSGPCSTCHAGPAGRASGRMEHRCPYLIDRKERLRCSGCHPDQVPPPGPSLGRCPVVDQHRPGCVVCHLDS